ncbi:cytochrome ubiquinol oxidase subunit I, partial [Lysobacter sp. 2RAB21]
RLYQSRAALWGWRVLTMSGFAAILAGWYVVEIGRQPYVIYGLLRTADAVSPIEAASVMTSLIVFAVVYLTVFGAGFRYLVRLIRKGPHPHEPPPRGAVQPGSWLK